MRIHLFSLILCLGLLGCGNKTKPHVEEEKEAQTVAEIEPDMRYGFDFNQYTAKQLKIKRGDTFGAILERNGIDYPQVYACLQKIKGKVSVRKLQL